MNLGKSKCIDCIRVFNPDNRHVFSRSFNSGCRQAVDEWQSLQNYELSSSKYWIPQPAVVRKL